MKQESDSKPLKNYEIENIKDGKCDVVLFDLNSIEEVESISENGEAKTLYRYNSYRIRKSHNQSLLNMLDNDFETMLKLAIKQNYDTEASKIRKIRNKLLADTDKEMAFDRLKLEIPENITMANIIKVFKDFSSALSDISNSEMAKYRQELRDITKQEEFPYNVIFPKKPEDN